MISLRCDIRSDCRNAVTAPARAAGRFPAKRLPGDANTVTSPARPRKFLINVVLYYHYQISF